MADSDFTRILSRFREGDVDADAKLMELAYHDLRRLAQRHLSGTRWMSTLNTTSLINESYLRLVSPASRHVESRDHFFALASRIMRHVVCDYAKSRIRASKRIDRDSEAETALAQLDAELADAHEMLRIDEALEDLAKTNDRQCRIIECRFFAGLTEAETAKALDTPLRTVQREWNKARDWLMAYLTDDSFDPPPASDED
jgi:RNA polymerase sigma factor (TIGR02999 family)